MTTPGLLIMIVSVGSVLSLVAFCMFRVLTLAPEVVEEQFKAPLDIDTGDTQDAD
jgi:hypothetical protein